MTAPTDPFTADALPSAATGAAAGLSDEAVVAELAARLLAGKFLRAKVCVAPPPPPTRATSQPCASIAPPSAPALTTRTDFLPSTYRRLARLWRELRLRALRRRRSRLQGDRRRHHSREAMTGPGLCSRNAAYLTPLWSRLSCVTILSTLQGCGRRRRLARATSVHLSSARSSCGEWHPLSAPSDTLRSARGAHG